MAVVRFLHVALSVSDLSRSVAFYRDLLGLRVAAEMEFVSTAAARTLALAPGTTYRVAALGRDGIRLELVQIEDRAVEAKPGSSGTGGVGLSHLAFAVDDLDATIHSLRDRGVEMVTESRTEFPYGATTCLARDPDGFLVALYEAPAGASSPYDDLD